MPPPTTCASGTLDVDPICTAYGLSSVATGPGFTCTLCNIPTNQPISLTITDAPLDTPIPNEKEGTNPAHVDICILSKTLSQVNRICTYSCLAPPFIVQTWDIPIGKTVEDICPATYPRPE